MSWFKPAAALAACLFLAGCGFRPLYGDGGERSEALAAQLASIKVTQIGERFGQVMTNTLHDGLNPHAMHVPTSYQLEVALRETSYNSATRADGTPSRTELTLLASWALRRTADNQVVVGGMPRSSVGFDVLNNDYTNVISAGNGELRAVRDLSDEIQASIASYFQTHPQT